jgi:Flp pilus assembly protein TadD
LEAGRLIQAEKMLQAGAGSGAPVADLQILRADLAFAKGDYRESLALYRSAAREGEAALVGAGLSALKLNQAELAEQYLRKALASSSPSWRAWNGLGVVLDRRLDPKAAEAAYREGLKLSPNNAILLNNLGYCLLMTGNAIGASDAFHRALATRPSDKIIKANLALADSLRGDYPRRRANETAEDWARRLNDAGYGAWLGGRLREARSLFSQAVLERPTRYEIAEQNLKAVEDALLAEGQALIR